MLRRVNKPLFTTLLLLFSLLSTLKVEAAFVDPKLKWYTLQTEHFNINYHEGEEPIAEKMAIITEKVYDKLSPTFRWKPWGRTEIVLTDTTDITNAFTSTLPYNYIILFINAPVGESTLNYYDNWLEDLFTHEFTHTLHLDMYGKVAKPFRWILGRIVTPNGLTPGWVREGIAVQQESLTGRGRANNSFSEMMLRTDILNDDFLSLDQMAGLQFDWPASNAAYIYGGKFWTYLAEKYGYDKVTEFSHRYSDSMWLFSLNNKAKKTFEKKSFYKLHREWKEELKQKYAQEKTKLEGQGLSSMKALMHVDKGIVDHPTVSPDGQYIVYSKSDVHNKPEIRRMKIDGSEDELIHKGRIGTQYSFSPDGKKVVFNSIGSYKHYYKYNELYEIDLESKDKDLDQLTQGLRAFHPDYSPDGKKIVFVANKLSSTRLYLWDVEERKETAITPEEDFIQFSNPRFSPDGKYIAVSVWRKGDRDIYLYNLDGTIAQQITNDPAIDLHPVFSADGKSLFFTSDKSGITNLYRYRMGYEKIEQVTNVITGVFQPSLTKDGIVVANYYGRGFDIQALDYDPDALPFATGTVAKLHCHPKKSVAASESNGEITAAELKSAESDLQAGVKEEEFLTKSTLSETEQVEAKLDEDLKVKKYNPFRKLFLPRYILPNIYFGDSVTITADIGSNDPLGWHQWRGGINYRFDANFLGGQFLYSYNRLRPTIYANFFDYVADYGAIFDPNERYFEERKRAALGASIGKGIHGLTGYYYFENRSEHSGIPEGLEVPTLGNFSGFGVTYTLARVHKFPASISLEGGPRFITNFEVSDSALGASDANEQVIFSGDLREYIPLPMDGHVFGIRIAGGYAWGDPQLQGTFRLGSALGEGTLTAITPRLFTLRGLPEITFSGEKAVLMSGEYRLPLIYPQRGAGTTPLHINKLYMVFFADYGTVVNDDVTFDKFLLGVGTELRGDFVIGYGLPITGRLGYGIIVDGREFITGLTDPITGSDIKYGTLILTLGTSF